MISELCWAFSSLWTWYVIPKCCATYNMTQDWRFIPQKVWQPQIGLEESQDTDLYGCMRMMLPISPPWNMFLSFVASHMIVKNNMFHVHLKDGCARSFFQSKEGLYYPDLTNSKTGMVLIYTVEFNKLNVPKETTCKQYKVKDYKS